MKNPMMQKVTLALSCAAVGLAVFDMTVKDARIHELTEEREIGRASCRERVFRAV